MAYPKGNFYGGDTLANYKLVNCSTADIDITGGTIDEVDITGGTIDEADITGGTVSGVDITDSTISGTAIKGSAFKTIIVDCTDDYALTDAQKDATYIIISPAGTSKVLTLGMIAGQRLTITNSGENSVTVKNLITDTGVVVTTAKTADFIVTTGEIIKLTADV